MQHAHQKKHNAPMPLRDQMGARQKRALRIVQRQQIPLRAFYLAVEQHHIALAAEYLAERLRLAAFGRRQDDARRRVLHQRGQHRLLTLRRFAGAAEQGHITGRAQCLVDTGGEFGKKGLDKSLMTSAMLDEVRWRKFAAARL